MKNFLSRFIGLLFLVSSVLASESSSRDLDSLLRHAAGSGSLAKCKKLLNQGAALNGQGRDGTTPLYAAAASGYCEVLKFLLENKAQMNKARDDFTTPLYVASQNGHGEAVKILLRNKALIDAASKNGATPLFIASQEGHSGIVQLLLGNNAKVDAAFDDGVTPLIVASQNGHGKVCQLLLDSNAAIDTQIKKNKRTALHSAVLHRHLECVTVLLKAGADVTVCDVQGETPSVCATNQADMELCVLFSRYAGETRTRELDSQLRHASGSGSVALCMKLLTQGAAINGRGQGGVTPLYAASDNGHVEVVKLLLESKSQVDAACDDGATPLLIATREGHVQIVQLLLESNAWVDAARKDGATPIFLASREGYFQIVKLLLNSKSQVNVACDDDSTPLLMATRDGYVEIVKLLLERKALVDAAMKDGSTPLFIASQKGHDEVCQFLLYSKATIDKQTKKDKKTALHTAVLHKRLNCVTMLVNASADITVRDVLGDTPLECATNQEISSLLGSYMKKARGLNSQLRYAAGSGNVATCEKLLAQGAEPNGRGQRGVTPLHIACYNNHDGVVRLLLGSKAQADVAKNDGVTPLFKASENGHSKIVKLLLEVNAHVDAPRNDGVTPLFTASENGHGKIVKLLLDVNAQVDAARNDGVTPLFIASQCGHDEVCQLLLGSKATINMQTKKDKRTALHIAVLHKHLACVSVLLIAGADVTACDIQGNTPIVYAASQRNRKLCILLSKYGAEIKVSRWSLNKSQKKLAKYVQNALKSDVRKVSSIDSEYQSVDHLLSKGQEMSHYSAVPSGEPLYYANVLSTLHSVAREGDCGKLEMIFEFGVPVDLLNDEGYTALHLAVLGGHYEMCSQLLEYGADKNIETPEGETALQIAQKVGHTDIVGLLKKIHEPEQEAVSSTDKDYQTFNRLVRAIKGVPESQAVLSGEQKEYEKIFSTLHEVAQTGDCEKLEMIFGFGVPVDLLNDDGFTALHLAVLGGHYEMCSQLLAYGADKNVETPEGETALQIAQRVGRKNLVKLLNSENS